MTPTLILSPRFSQDSNDLWRAAGLKGWNVHRAYRYLGPEPPVELPFVYGEILFCDIMADRLDLGLLDPPNDWLGKLPQNLLKRAVVSTTVEALPGVDSKSFIKPANDKVFQAGIYEYGKDVPIRYVDKRCPIYVSEIVEFEIEVRFAVLDRKVLTGEAYLQKVERASEEAIAEAEDWLNQYLASPAYDLPSAVVIDVGHIADRGWAIIESNQLYSSGIYGSMRRDLVLEGLVRAAGPRHLVGAEDQKYLRT